MGLPQQRERITVDGLSKIKPIKLSDDLLKKDYSDIIYLKGMLSNREVRKWYIAHDKTIIDLINKNKNLEDQARYAHSLRNKYKYQARELMRDQNLRKALDIDRPIRDFDYYFEKYSKNYSSIDDVYRAIINSSGRPNKKVNMQLGLD